MRINLPYVARLVSEELGVPVLISVLEERIQAPERQDQAPSSCYGTNSAASKVTSAAAEAMIGNALELAVTLIADENCPCEVCEGRLTRFKAALAVFDGEHRRVQRRVLS